MQSSGWKTSIQSLQLYIYSLEENNHKGKTMVPSFFKMVPFSGDMLYNFRGCFVFCFKSKYFDKNKQTTQKAVLESSFKHFGDILNLFFTWQ